LRPPPPPTHTLCAQPGKERASSGRQASGLGVAGERQPLPTLAEPPSVRSPLPVAPSPRPPPPSDDCTRTFDHFRKCVHRDVDCIVTLTTSSHCPHRHVAHIVTLTAGAPGEGAPQSSPAQAPQGPHDRCRGDRGHDQGFRPRRCEWPRSGTGLRVGFVSVPPPRLLPLPTPAPAHPCPCPPLPLPTPLPPPAILVAGGDSSMSSDYERKGVTVPSAHLKVRAAPLVHQSIVMVPSCFLFTRVCGEPASS
jgi:hypothetical protein